MEGVNSLLLQCTLEKGGIFEHGAMRNSTFYIKLQCFFISCTYFLTYIQSEALSLETHRNSFAPAVWIIQCSLSEIRGFP